MINDQFDYIYQNDAELRQMLGDQVAGMSLEDKYSIMNSYMKHGGVQGLLMDDENEGLDADEAKAIEDQFNEIYQEDAKLREVLQDQTPQTLSLREKYELLVAYKKGGGVEGLLGAPGDEDEEKSVVIHNGQKFTKVQIEGDANDYFMDE